MPPKRERSSATPGSCPSTIEQAPPDVRDTMCRCVSDVVATLKPEYQDVLRRVDLDGAAIAEIAREAGITANNASVRLHRARAALRGRIERACGACATHGCLDCTCGRRV